MWRNLFFYHLLGLYQIGMFCVALCLQELDFHGKGKFKFRFIFIYNMYIYFIKELCQSILVEIWSIQVDIESFSVDTRQFEIIITLSGLLLYYPALYFSNIRFSTVLNPIFYFIIQSSTLLSALFLYYPVQHFIIRFFTSLSGLLPVYRTFTNFPVFYIIIHRSST